MQGATECLSAAKAEVKKNLVREYLTLLQVSTPLAHEPWPNFNHGLLDLAPFVTVLFFRHPGIPTHPPLCVCCRFCFLLFFLPAPCTPSGKILPMGRRSACASAVSCGSVLHAILATLPVLSIHTFPSKSFPCPAVVSIHTSIQCGAVLVPAVRATMLESSLLPLPAPCSLLLFLCTVLQVKFGCNGTQ